MARKERDYMEGQYLIVDRYQKGIYEIPFRMLGFLVGDADGTGNITAMDHFSK